MHLIDTHCHLFMEPMSNRVDQVLARAEHRGIFEVIVPAYDLKSWQSLKSLTGDKRVYAAYGLHPWVFDEPLLVEALKSALEDKKAVGVGEIGLDFKIDNVDRTKQVELLAMQLDLAVEMDLPVLLHCRGAFEEMLSLLQSYDGRLKGVVHAFSKGPALAKRFVDLGFHVGFGGAFTRPNAKKARQSAASVPFEYILLETDAPSIGLDGISPQDVEPRHIFEIAEAVAKLRGVDVERVAEETTANALKLFGKINP